MFCPVEVADLLRAESTVAKLHVCHSQHICVSRSPLMLLDSLPHSPAHPALNLYLFLPLPSLQAINHSSVFLCTPLPVCMTRLQFSFTNLCCNILPVIVFNSEIPVLLMPVNMLNHAAYKRPRESIRNAAGCKILKSPLTYFSIFLSGQLQFLQHQMQQQMAMGAAAPQGGVPQQHTASQPRSKRKRSTPQPLSKS